MVTEFIVAIFESELSKFQVLRNTAVCDRDHLTIIRPQIGDWQLT